jgi:predicted transcriptional regulator
MKSIKTITISIPDEMGKDIQKLAKEEQRTISELMRESFRQYRAQRMFKQMVKQGKATVKRKGLKPKDFGGSFEE